MRTTRHFVPLLAVLAFLPLTGCTAPARDDGPKPPTLAAWGDLTPLDDGRVFLGAQPSDEALDAFVSSGGGLVINLRTDEEMAFLPYYDRSVASRGLRYTRIPTSGSGLGTATDAALADALESAGGRPVLLHCASGGRATYAYAMRRMASEGLSPDEAAAWVVEQRGEISDRGRELLRAFADERAGVTSAPESGQD